MSDTPESPDEKEPRTRLAACWDLNTLGDARRALAATCRDIRSGSLEPKTGHSLVIALGTLAKVMQDQRDSLWTKRAAKMWREFEKKDEAPDDAEREAGH